MQPAALALETVGGGRSGDTDTYALYLHKQRASDWFSTHRQTRHTGDVFSGRRLGKARAAEAEGMYALPTLLVTGPIRPSCMLIIMAHPEMAGHRRVVPLANHVPRRENKQIKLQPVFSQAQLVC